MAKPAKAIKRKTPEHIRINLEAYKRLDKKTVKKYSKKFALFHSAKLIDIYDERFAAICAGYEKFPKRDFMVKEIDEGPLDLGRFGRRVPA